MAPSHSISSGMPGRTTPTGSLDEGLGHDRLLPWFVVPTIVASAGAGIGRLNPFAISQTARTISCMAMGALSTVVAVVKLKSWTNAE